MTVDELRESLVDAECSSWGASSEREFIFDKAREIWSAVFVALDGVTGWPAECANAAVDAYLARRIPVWMNDHMGLAVAAD